MYAIVETGGKQHWVVPGETLQVDKLEAKEGDHIQLKVLWVGAEDKDAEKIESSQKAKVTAEVVRRLRGPKIIVFKKRPKSNYSRQKGHRQELTEIRIKEISLN